MHHNDSKHILDLKTSIRAHFIDLKKVFHPWELVYLKRVDFSKH